MRKVRRSGKKRRRRRRRRRRRKKGKRRRKVCNMIDFLLPCSVCPEEDY